MSIFKRESSVLCPANCSTSECPLILELRELIIKEKTLSQQFSNYTKNYGMSFWLSDNLSQDAVDLLNKMHNVFEREIEIEQTLGIMKA